MTYDRWQDLRESIREKYDIEEEKINKNDDGIGTCETIVFIGPGGRIRLELLKRPVRLGAKTSYSKRIGSDVAVEYQYSDTDESITLKAYRFIKDDDEWEEIHSHDFS